MLIALLPWIANAEQAQPPGPSSTAPGAAPASGATSCRSAPFWSGHRPDCEWLGHNFYATGVLAQADAAALRAKGWGSLVSSPAEYDFEEAVWHGPLLVLVDSNTGSAAEEFAAVLQDNKAAAVIGAPTTLSHSRAVLELPDCARIRLDGSNEVAGIDPDVLVGFRATDAMRRKGLRLMKALPRGLSVATRLCRGGRCGGARPADPRGGGEHCRDEVTRARGLRSQTAESRVGPHHPVPAALGWISNA